MALTAKDALARYASAVGSTKASQHLAVVRQYLAWGGNGTGPQLPSYWHYLLSQKGYKSGTIAYHQRILRAFFRANQLPVPPMSWHHAETADMRVAFSLDWMAQAIALARLDAADPADRWILALATTYGVRSVEVARLTLEDVDLIHHRIFWHTAKHGDARWQWLPLALEAQWATMGGVTVTLKRVHAAVKNLAALGDLPLQSGADLHAIRRGLVVALDQAGLSDLAIGHFMRWQHRPGQGGTVYREKHRYSHPTQVIGIGEAPQDSAEILPGSRAEDATVWEAHPLLHFWEN